MSREKYDNQNKDNEALYEFLIKKDSTRLIEYFKSFIEEYQKIITLGEIDLTKKRHRYLVTLFISDSKIRGMIKGGTYMNKESYKAVDQVVKFIQSCFPYEHEVEIFHDLIIPLLRMASIYTEKGVGFERFVRNWYNKYLKHYMSTDKIKDPVDYAERFEYYLHEEILYINTDLFKKETVEDYDISQEIELDDTRFIRGDLSGVFKEFSVVDRKILTLHYAKGLSDKQISTEVSLHPSSIQRRRKQIEGILLTKMESGEIKNCIRLLK